MMKAQFLVVALLFSAHHVRANDGNTHVGRTVIAEDGHELLASGCSMVYLDIGSNVGVQIRKLYEPEKYSGATILSFFDEFFGDATSRARPSSETGLCAIGFEANPEHVPRLREIERIYQSKGWKVHFVAPQVVADTSNATVTFYMDNQPNVNRWGSSVRPWKEGMSKVQVQTLDLARYLEDEVFPAKPKVFTKMDIEGSEFVVLPKMEEFGQLCQDRMSKIYIEWHPQMRPPTTEDESKIMAKIAGAKTCQGSGTSIVSSDDESYLLDGQPLPAQGSVVVPTETPKSESALQQDMQISQQNTGAIYAAYLAQYQKAQLQINGITKAQQAQWDYIIQSQAGLTEWKFPDFPAHKKEETQRVQISAHGSIVRSEEKPRA